LCLAPLATGQDATPKPKHDDGRRTGARFLSNLGRNAVGMFGRENLKPFLIGAAATGLSTPFDDDLKRYFEEERRAKWLGDTASFVGKAYVIAPAAAALYGVGRLSNNQRFRDFTYDIAQTTIINAAYTTAIKLPSHRLRPDGSDYLSFPSGHTSNAFAWATVGTRHYGAKAGVPGFLWAGLMAVGRMEKNRHYLSDVVGGATLGVLSGLTCVRRDGAPKDAPRLSLATLPSPSGDGVGVSLLVDF
jgi:membrane-associated phospholipid phosphatase